MPFRISITEDADRQLRWLTVREQRIVSAAIMSKLTQNPTTPTRAIRQLRPNPLVQFELRAGNLRVV